MAAGEKSPDAFKTISELSQQLGVPQHILRYWETRFPQLKPMQRAGNRRYYRPSDVQLACKIHHLLYEQGYTVRGVQQVLKSRAPMAGPVGEPAAQQAPASPDTQQPSPAVSIDRLIAVRDRLAAAIAD